MSYGGTGKPYVEEALTMLPSQMNVLNQLSGILGGQIGRGIEPYSGQTVAGESPLQTQAFATAQQMLGRIGDPEKARGYWETAFKEPAMESWKKDIIPGIQEQFIAQGAGTGSGINRAIAESGQRLGMGLSSQLEQILKGEEQWLPTLTDIGGTQRGIQQEQLGGEYQRWQSAQPWANPWLGQLGNVLGAQAFENIASPKQIQGGLCVLATATYGKDSDEVNFFRMIRDHLPRKIVRGYYVFSDLVLPLMRIRLIKNLIRATIVNPLLVAGQKVVLHRSLNVKSLIGSGITLGWLVFWRILGSRGVYTRRTGESV